VSNCVELTGRLVDAAELRHSPAGVPIARALLEHDSEQSEAGARRAIRFRVGLNAAGAGIAESLAQLGAGDPIRVRGILRRSRQRNAETDPIIISVSRVERLAETE
jgi:primosomal replication protein N